MRKELSEQDRVELALRVSRNDRDYLIDGLSEGHFVPLDLITSQNKHPHPGLAYSPLEIAALNQHWELVNSIVAYRVDVDDPKQQEQIRMIFSRVLVIAAMYNQTNIASQLVYRVDPNYIVTKKDTGEGRTVLHFFIFHRQKTMIQMLLKAGADPLLSAKKLLSPIEYAIQLAREIHPDYWKLIPSLVMVPISSSSPEATKNLYTRILFLATTNNQMLVVQHLLMRRANPNLVIVRSGPLAGYTTLHMAHRKKNRAMALQLLAHGADPVKKAADGSSFQSLTQDKELKKILSASNIQKKAEYTLQLKKELLTSNSSRSNSVSNRYSNSASAIRENLFSFFGISSSERIEEAERKIADQVIQIKQLGEETKVQSDRVDSLQGMVFNQEKLQISSSTTNLFSGRNRKSHGSIPAKKISKPSPPVQSA